MNDDRPGPAASWDPDYRRRGRIWGDRPSELVGAMLPLLRATGDRLGRPLHVVDLGCGYGRDAVALSRELHARILAVDPSPSAIAMARAALPPGAHVEFRCAGFADLSEADGRFDAVLAAALYHLLDPAGREAFRAAAAGLLEDGGLLLLSALSPDDRHHFGRGTPVDGEERSFVGSRYLHFCTRRELLDDFAFLDVVDLRRVESTEVHVDGVVHRHSWWVMAARRRQARQA